MLHDDSYYFHIIFSLNCQYHAATTPFNDFNITLSNDRTLDKTDNRLSAILRSLSLLVVGPVGAYAAYNFLFVLRYLPSGRYPVLEAIYRGGGLMVELAIVTCLTAAFVWMCVRRPFSYSFVPSRASLPPYANALIVVAIAALIALSVYRVLGTFNVANFAANFALYRALATRGNAWMILACYAGIYLVLLDMYFGGVTKLNATSFLSSIMIVSLSGGRTILILFAVAFLIMLLFQRISWWKFIMVAALATLLMLSSYFLVTNLRAPPEPVVPVETTTSLTDQNSTSGETQLLQEELEDVFVEPTESFSDLNYNAAFITEDVIRELRSGELAPGPYFLGDLTYKFVPRAIAPNKPLSSAETRALYPDVAARGTNITFPLKANLMVHVGEWAFYLDWVVVAAFQLLLMFGIVWRNRSPTTVGFVALSFGATFTLIGRGGLLNARLIDQVLCILVAWAAYRALKLLDRKARHLIDNKAVGG